ncbi:hypothetical protein V6N13_105078 [Hibiscus sabdariffa]|uniref:Uncharacterized protein n=1 Tax=Hibiscus sabdariffa TaxID=183260 RepID=A0ABR2AHN2_9ROSI
MPGEEGLHCSVKPASRSTLLSGSHDTRSFHPSAIAQLLAWNGQAITKPREIRIKERDTCTIISLPPLGSQASARKLGEKLGVDYK